MSRLLESALGLARGFVLDEAEDELARRLEAPLGDLSPEQRAELARDAHALGDALVAMGPGGHPRIKRASRLLAEITVPVLEKTLSD